jgi:stearoyl-CoA desaturase (Delta-9 desaturase)
VRPAAYICRLTDWGEEDAALNHGVVAFDGSPHRGRAAASTGVEGVARFSARHLAFVGPLVVLHLACGLVFVVGASRVAILVFALTCVAQLVGLTMGYHRLLTHRSFETSRSFQFMLALLGTLAGQNGPLWWVGHHLYHHRYADQEDDIHSPRAGLFRSHMGWLFSPHIIPIRHDLVTELARLPEMRLLQRFSSLVFLGYAGVLYLLGVACRRIDPAGGVSGMQLIVWGSVLGTVCIFHLVLCLGSVAHRYGTRSFPTRDDSRNNVVLALLLLGEGWHNNHHYCPASARMGFQWWELDANYVILSLLARIGIVWGLKVPPPRALGNR